MNFLNQGHDRSITSAPFVKGLAKERYKKLNPELLKLPFSKHSIEKSRELRKGMTFAERKIWREILSRDQMEGWRFLRQKPIGKYIVDFYCSKLLLVIEVDGSQHYTDDGLEYDQKRTEDLSIFGIRVIRYSNQDVMENIEGVYLDLKEKIEIRKKELAI